MQKIKTENKIKQCTKIFIYRNLQRHHRLHKHTNVHTWVKVRGSSGSRNGRYLRRINNTNQQGNDNAFFTL